MITKLLRQNNATNHSAHHPVSHPANHPANQAAHINDAASAAGATSRHYDQLHPGRARQMNPNPGRTSGPAHRTGRGR